MARDWGPPAVEYVEPPLDVMTSSRIEMWRRCPRQLVAKYVEGLEFPRTGYSGIGDWLHELAREYLDDGTLPSVNLRWDGSLPIYEFSALTGRPQLLRDADGVPRTKEHTFYPGRMLLGGIKHLPEPGTVVTEESTTFRDGGGLMWRATRDFRSRGLVGDHKSCGSFGYTLAAKQNPSGTHKLLIDNPQAVLYAAVNMDEYDTDSTELRWVYYARDPARTRGQEAKKVSVNVTRSEILPRMHNLQREAEQVLRLLSDSQDADSVIGDVTACDSMGGCPRWKQCTQGGNFAAKGGTTMSKINWGKAKVERATTVNPPEPEYTPPTGGPDFEQMTREQLKLFAGDNGLGDYRSSKMREDKLRATISEAYADAAKVPLAALENALDLVISEVEGTEDTSPSTLDAPVIDPALTRYPYECVYDLYIDCLPIDRQYVLVSKLLELYLIQAAEMANVEHFRLADYNKGAGYLTYSVTKDLKEGTFFEGGALVLLSSSYESHHLRQALVQYADTVTLGIK